MKKNKNIEPSSAFYNFQVYDIEENSTWKEGINSSLSIVVLLKNATTEDLNLLGKIFQAVGRNIEEEVCVINTLTTVSYKELATLFHLEKVLVFGIHPKEFGLHLNIDIYQTFIFQEVQFLFSDTLQVIASNLPKKKLLWAQLQAMFK